MTDDEFQVDPTPNGPDKEANERKLQETLKNYQQAMQEEWETNEKLRRWKTNSRRD